METVSFWDKVYWILGTVFLLLFTIGYLFRLTKKEKQALTNIDHFIFDNQTDNSDENNPSMKTEIQSLNWKDSEIEIFFRDYVNPYAGILKEIDAFEGITKLLEILDKEGNCSSIAKRYPDSKTKAKGPDIEAEEWLTHQEEGYDILSKNVSLREHTLGVATLLIEKRKKESKDFQMEMGRLLFASLGHDIGKIPSTNRIHRGKDHFIVSYEIMNVILPTNYPSRDDILTAVRDHHYASASSGSLLKNLKAADHQARQSELKKYGYNKTNNELIQKTTERHGPQIKMDTNKPKYDPVDLSWLDLSQLLELVSNRINVVENGKYEAFSHTGIVYVYPLLLARLACDLAIKGGRMEILAYSTNKEKMGHLMFAIRQVLNEHIPDGMIGQGYIGRRFQIVTKKGRAMNPGFYIPLKISSFKNATSMEIEKRKQNTSILQSIQRVSIFSSNVNL